MSHAGETIGMPAAIGLSPRPDADECLVWSVDPEQGVVQGPLDLEFLRDRDLILELSDGQMALLVDEREVRSVFLEGSHRLRIGTASRAVPPECRLVFLAPADVLHFRWPASGPLSWGAGAERAIIGSCTLAIDRPGQFHRTFIDGAEACEDAVLRGLIEQILRGAFEERLVSYDGSPGSSADTQARLARITTDDLDESLEPYGLRCEHLAVYTAAPPVEAEGRLEGVAAALHTAGHFDGVGHN